MKYILKKDKRHNVNDILYLIVQTRFEVLKKNT